MGTKAIIMNGNKALTPTGEVYDLHGLVIRADNGERFYPYFDRFFKIACPPGTEHYFRVLDTGMINVY